MRTIRKYSAGYMCLSRPLRPADPPALLATRMTPVGAGLAVGTALDFGSFFNGGADDVAGSWPSLESAAYHAARDMMYQHNLQTWPNVHKSVGNYQDAQYIHRYTWVQYIYIYTP